MDNHKGAFAFWKELGVVGATCVHVDAHPDISNFQLPEPGALEHPELNCGNFLYPAMQDGMVEHVVWVIPPHLPGATPSLVTWAQVEMQNWMWLTVAEMKSFHLADGRVEASLGAGRLTICTSDHLPTLAPSGPTLLDIDVDYFFDLGDRVWQCPVDLHAQLSALEPSAVTVAYSVDGGYTPPQHRYVGDLTHLCFTGQVDEARSLWQDLQSATPRAEAPAWYEAALLAREAFETSQGYRGPAWDRAAARDEGYRLRPLDVASYYMHRKKNDQCLEWLDRAEGDVDRAAARYLRGLVALRLDDPATAETHWGDLLELPVARGSLAAHLHEMRGKARVMLRRDADAIESFQAAIRQTPQNASLWRQVAQAQLRTGQREVAARSFRRAVALAPHLQATVQARWDLARLYVDLGQHLLARAELHQVAARDGGTLGAKARMLMLKLEGGSSMPTESCSGKP